MYNYKKTVLSPYDPTKLAINPSLRPKMIFFQIVVRMSKRLFLLMTLYTSLTRRTLLTCVDFDCGITLLPETLTKIRQINRERKNISRSCEKPQCIPSSDQHTCSVDEQQNSNVSLNPYNLWDMFPAALMPLNHTNHTYSMFNQYPQPTTQQPRTDSNLVFLQEKKLLT